MFSKASKQSDTGVKAKVSAKKVLLIILASIAGLVILVLLGARLYFRIPVADYYKASEKTFEIPGISDGFVAQGLCYDEGCFYVTGYMQKGTPSPIYLVDEETGKLTKSVYMATPDHAEYHGHCGGLSVRAPYIYVAGGKGLYIFDLEEIKNAEDGALISALGYFNVGDKEQDTLGVAFTAIKGDQLVVGEFYREANYPTADKHKLTTPAGDYNQALALVYNFSDAEGSLFGLESQPVAAYSMPDQVQGMAFQNGKMYLSISYGTALSHILVYDESKLSSSTYDFNGQTLPLSFCDSAALTSDVKIAPMSEELAFVNDKLYVMCESASNKYIFGKFTSAKWCYATDMSQLEK